MSPKPRQQATRSWRGSPPSPPRPHSSPAPWAARAPRAPRPAEPSSGTFSSRGRTRTRRPTCWRRVSSVHGITAKATASTTPTRSFWAWMTAANLHCPPPLHPTTETATVITMATITTTTTTPATTTHLDPTQVTTRTTPPMTQIAEITIASPTTTELTTLQTPVTTIVFQMTVHRLTTPRVVATVTKTTTGLHEVALRTAIRPTMVVHRHLTATLFLQAAFLATLRGRTMVTAGTILLPPPTAIPTPVLPPMTSKCSHSPTPQRRHMKDRPMTMILVKPQLLIPQMVTMESLPVSPHTDTTPLWTAGLT